MSQAKQNFKDYLELRRILWFDFMINLCGVRGQ